MMMITRVSRVTKIQTLSFNTDLHSETKMQTPKFKQISIVPTYSKVQTNLKSYISLEFALIFKFNDNKSS